MTKKKAPKSVIHGKTRLIGEPYEEDTLGHIDAIAVYGQRFETKGNKGGISGTWEIEKLVRRYVLERVGDEIESKAGKSIKNLGVSVFVSSSSAIVVIENK